MIAAPVNPSMRPFLPVADNLLIYSQNVRIGQCFRMTDFYHLVDSQMLSRHSYKENIFTGFLSGSLPGLVLQEQSIWLTSSDIQKMSGRFWLTQIR